MDDTDSAAGSCKCQFLSTSAADPDLPIQFLQETGEFVFVYGDHGQIMLYFCPICGGKAPKSWRDSLFQKIADEELERLGHLTRGIATKEDALRVLGPPNEEVNDTGTTTTLPKGDEAPRTEMSDPELWYRDHSETADIIVILKRVGPARVVFAGKLKAAMDTPSQHSADLA